MFADQTSGNQQANSQVLHPGSRKLFHYWETLRAEAACPCRADFALAAIKETVPNLFIMERRSLPLSYRFRLAGTAISEILGLDPTGGEFLNDWDSFEKRLISDVMDIAFNRKQPALLRMRLTRNSRSMTGVEMIALPYLIGKGSTQLIGGLHSFTAPPGYHDPVVQRELITARTLWTEHGTGDELLRSAESRGVPLLRVIQGGLT